MLRDGPGNKQEGQGFGGPCSPRGNDSRASCLNSVFPSEWSHGIFTIYSYSYSLISPSLHTSLLLPSTPFLLPSCSLSFLSFLSLLYVVYSHPEKGVCLYVYRCTCTHMHMYVEARNWQWWSFSISPTHYFYTKFFPKPLTHQCGEANWPVSSRDPGITDVCCHTWYFHVVTEDPNSGPHVIQQALYWLSHVSGPCPDFLSAQWVRIRLKRAGSGPKKWSMGAISKPGCNFTVYSQLPIVFNLSLQWSPWL